MSKHFYYAVVFVGTTPVPFPISTPEPLDSAERILNAAAQIRQTMMQTARRVNFPNVVIVSLIPCAAPANIVAMPQ